MIVINTVDTKFFTLDGVKFARIYQPLAQGSEAIGLYSIYDTKLQLVNSTKFDEFYIDGFSYPSQEDTIAVLLGVIWSGVSDYDVDQLEGRVDNLEENQVTGVETYATYADLPATGTLLVSYKVSNDSTVSNNGYYHWDGSQYVKDIDLNNGVIESGNVESVKGGDIYDEFETRFASYDKISILENIAAETTYTDYFVYAGALSTGSVANFITKMYNIENIDKIKLDGVLRGGTDIQVYAFYSSSVISSATLISEELGTGSTETYNTVLSKPSGATYLMITKNPNVDELVPVEVSVENLSERIDSLEEEVFEKPITTTINREITDFTGSVNKTLNDIQTKWPNAKIIVCTSLKNGGYPGEDNLLGENMTYLTVNRIGKFQEEYNDRIKECCNLHGIEFVDLYNEAGYDPLNSAQASIFTHNTTDKLHPIQAGHIRIAEILYRKIKNMFRNDTDLTGVKAIFIGDSITHNLALHTPKVFYKYLAEWLGLQDDGMSDNGLDTIETIDYPKNAGIAGSGYSQFCPVDNPIYGRLSSYNNDYELVVIFAGVNDFYSNSSGIFGYLYQ